MIKNQLIALSTTFLRDRNTRRKLLFAFTLITLLFSFCGGFIIDNLLRENLILFIIYWLFAILLVLIMILMALYDMLRSKIEIINEAKTEVDKIIEDINENIVEKNNSENNTSK
jgi:uncharacterized membrane protein YfcA|tara:strand:+ start:600 stop:941 length:342 start_codon:yes stop_codon:yes gene_type:complete